MTTQNQDFTTYAGDTINPIFQVLAANGNPIDISTANDVVWTAARTISSAPVITKKKSTGGIVFTTTGTDGEFTVKILGTDTATLAGYYDFWATVTDGTGA